MSQSQRKYAIEEYREKFGDAAANVANGQADGPSTDQMATESGGANAPQIPNFDEIEEAAPDAADLPGMDRALPIASAILGTDVGAHLLARDLVSGVAETLIDKLLDTMEEFAEDVDTFVDANGVRYNLTRLTGMTSNQRKAAFAIIDEVKEMFSGDVIDINGVLSTLMGSGRAEELFAILYMPEGERFFRPDTLPARIEAMGDLTLGQQLGALYRFFISKGSFIRDGIRTFLVELADRQILKL